LFDIEDQKLMLKQIGRFVKSQTDPLRDEIAALKAQLEELQARKYFGVHQRAQSYKAGAQVTAGGALWICIADAEPNECPGASPKWQLCVKSSGNGKDHDAQRRLPTQGGARPSSIVEKRT
jgi:hypothetical protein